MDRDVAIGLVEMLEAIKGTLDSILDSLSFVWRNVQTHFARCKSFRPPFLKGGGSGQSPAFPTDKSKFEDQKRPPKRPLK